MAGDLTGRTAIITGGPRGIGRAPADNDDVAEAIALPASDQAASITAEALLIAGCRPLDAASADRAEHVTVPSA